MDNSRTTMATLTIDIDLPDGVTISSYHRLPNGHGIEVAFPLPQRLCCSKCRREQPVRPEYKNKMQVVRDLDILNEPSFWVYQPAFHRCPWCHHRQTLLPAFKRKDTSYTFRFEQHVLRLLIGSNEEEVARRLGISAETVALIVRNQLADAKDKQIDPTRVITDVGIDEISLKKRHKLYVTILTDLTDPLRPQVLAVATGRDEEAARTCLEKLSAEQRLGVQTYRADMSQAYHNACGAVLKKAQAVVDRFHVAKNFNEAIDRERKKNHPRIQGQAVCEAKETIPYADVGISPSSEGSVGEAKARSAGPVPGDSGTEDPVPTARPVPENL
jgi:transposase